ncbi:MAG: acyltransferase [Rhodoferax sp.]|uniref:acyltransferase family protein n=1 Tax=Rhodoferax sp. TaxID=50421 RepID=UPI002636FDD3|nr:acyltransferase [Rhodoferax sp.]MDD5332951.1 acyltransferase [Rhodoferax sp.]
MGILRTIFALAVVFAHSPWNSGLVFVGPRNAVQLFYITSGFLISYVLTERGGYGRKATFYLSRFLRLYPLYFAVASLTLVIYLLANPQFFELYRDMPLSADISLALTNALLFGQDWIMFSAVRSDNLVFATNFNNSDFALWKGLLIPQAWSLGVELSFYLIAPFVLPRRKLLLTLLVCSLLLRVVLIVNGIGKNDPWTYRFFPTELAFFLVGSLSHQILLPLYRKFFGAALKKSSLIVTIVLAAFSVLYFVVPVSGLYKAPILFSCFILFLPLTFAFQNQYKFDGKIGDLSYPIYIGHFLVIFVLGLFFKQLDITNELFISISNAIFSIVFAVALNWTIGDRIESIRAKVKMQAVKRIRYLSEEP